MKLVLLFFRETLRSSGSPELDDDTTVSRENEGNIMFTMCGGTSE